MLNRPGEVAAPATRGEADENRRRAAALAARLAAMSLFFSSV